VTRSWKTWQGPRLRIRPHCYPKIRTERPGWLAPLAVAIGGLALVLIVASSLSFAGRILVTAAVIVAAAAMLVIPAS
jgi:hypothetical protein